MAFRRKEIQGLEGKTRLSMADKQLLDLTAAYQEQLDETYGLSWPTDAPEWKQMGGCFRLETQQATAAMAAQRARVALLKKQGASEPLTTEELMQEPWDIGQPREPEEVTPVPMPLAMQGPGACAWELVKQAGHWHEEPTPPLT